jgi:hypothetical protein
VVGEKATLAGKVPHVLQGLCSTGASLPVASLGSRSYRSVA